MRLLIVEDNTELAASMKTGMEKYGFSVDVANYGEEGEQLAVADHF